MVLVETGEAASTVDAGLGWLVAVSPWAEVELERRGIAFSRPEDYADRAARKQLGLDNFARTLRVTDLLDRCLLEGGPLAGSGFRPGFAHYFWLKVAIDALTQRLFDLDAVLRALKPSTVMFWPTPPMAGAETRLDFMGESIWALLAPMVAQRAGIAAEPLAERPWHPGAAPPARDWGRARRAVWRTLAARGLLPRRSATDRGVLLLDLALVPALLAHSRLRVVYSPAGAGWEIDLTQSLPRRRRLAGDAGLAKSIGSGASERWAELANGKSLRSELEYAGCDLLPVLSSRLEHLSTHGLAQLAAVFVTARTRLQAGDIGAVVSQSFSEAPRRAVAMAARAASVPVIAYDHGAMGYFDFPMDRYLDSASAAVRLVWGQGVKASVERRYAETARPITVGSIHLDNLARRPQARRSSIRSAVRRSLRVPAGVPLVLYVVTSMSTNHAYESHRICSDSDYYARQRRIISALAQQPDINFVVKLHSAPHQPASPVVEWARMSGIDNVQFISEPPLDQLIDAADMFINDSPTTTLLEMLTRKQPVLACGNGGLLMEADALSDLHAAAFYTESVDDLITEVRRRLSDRPFQPGDDSSNFLRRYGTDLGDGRSAERVAGAIATMAGSVA